jgi:rRNA-processing protein FCF1
VEKCNGEETDNLNSQSVEKTSMIRDHPLSHKVHTQIVLDTNFIVSLLKQRRDLETEIRTAVPGSIRIVVLDLVLLELERLARKGSSNIRTWANAAIDFLSKRDFPVIEHRPGPADVDVSLMQFALAEKLPTAIATIDGGLLDALKSFDVPTISPRARYGLISERLRL